MRYRNLHNTIFFLFESIFTDYQCYITMITRSLQTLIIGVILPECFCNTVQIK